jgi:hypothetical protein
LGWSCLAALLGLSFAAPAAGQSTQPVWWPPMSLYGRPLSSPFFDFPAWSRYTYCRPAPLAWGYDPFPNYGPCDPGAAMGYPTVACPANFVAHRPSGWYGSASFAPLTVDHLDGFPLARLGPSGAVVLSTEDLRTEFAPGGKYTIGRRIFDCYRVEGTYLGFNSWNDQRLVTNADPTTLGGTGNLSTFLSGFSSPATAGLDGANFVAASLRSNFQSGEVNVRYWGEMPPGPLDVSFLVGARYMRIAEQFQFDSQSALPSPAGTTNDLQSNVTNNMWGVQIGLEFAVLVSTRWWFDFDMKGGIYNDQVNAVSAASQNGVSTLITDTRNRTAFVGDLCLTANWQMTPSWAFRLGYQAIFINGVTLAQDQLVSSLFNNVAGPLNDKGKVAYHGPLIGLTANW